VKIVDLTANVNVTNTTAIRNCDKECSHAKLGLLDQMQNKVVSRKLLVFLCATGLLIWSSLDPDTWAMIAAMYIGGQSVIDIAKVWKGA
jgi:hypothetical protein